MDNLIWSIDNDCRVTTANSGYRKLFNVDIPVAADKGAIRFFENPDETWVAHYQRVLKGETFIVQGQIFNSVTGSKEKRLFSFDPVYNQDGEQTGATCYSLSASSVTPYLEQSALSGISFDKIMDALPDTDKKYKYLFENNPCAMYIWDLETFRILDCNYEALLKYGYSKDEFIKLNVSDLIFPDDLPRLKRVAAQKNTTGLIGKQNWRQLKKNGEVIFTEISGYLIDFNDRKISFIQINDLTEKENVLAQLKESEAKLHTATRIARLGYWQLNADGTDRYWSDEVYEIWGLSRDTFVVTFDSFLNTLHPDDREAFEKEQFAYHNWKKTFDLEYRIILPDGLVKWVYEKGKLLEDENGNPVIFQGMVQDITSQKLLSLSLEESNKRYQYITKATFDAIWDWDLVKETLHWGEGFQHIFGYNLNDIETTIASWTEHIHPVDLDRVVSGIYKSIDSNETLWQDEYRYLKADGNFAYVADKGFVIRDENGKAVRMVGAMQDITERKKAENELKSFADELYKRNKELHEFGYIVSHNLRSPIANIMGTVNLLELDREDPDTVDQCIKDIKNSVTRLDVVIRDLSKILSVTDGSVALNKENIDVTELLSNVKTDFKKAIKNSSVIIQVPSQSYTLYSHKAYLYSILFNLVSNAIKYRSEKTPLVKIDIDQTAQFTIITITDNGIGIDLKKHADDLFKPYKRFHLQLEGKGLGLFLVKSHIEALDGTITVESEPGRGTTFTIVFPTNVKEVKGHSVLQTSKTEAIKVPGML